MNTAATVPGSAGRRYQVQCVAIEVLEEASGHRHVVALETEEPEGRTAFRWTIVEAIAAIREGGQFIVGGSEAGQAAVLEPAVCPRCSQVTLAEATVEGLARCS